MTRHHGVSRLRAFSGFLPALALLPIVLNDYRLRRLGIRPDRWHWADRAMWWLGWVAV